MKALVVKLKRKDCPGSVPGLSKTLMLLLCFFSLLNAGCKKDIEEPKHKNKGKNVIYLKIDEQEFLIKEGFSLNKNVIRADIQGNFGAENPTFYQYDYFGKTATSISVLMDKKSSSRELGKCNWDITFYESGEKGSGLSNGITVNYFSEKYGRWITIHEIGYGWPGEFSPNVTIEEHDLEKKIISGTYEFIYRDLADSNLTGNYYMYFKLNYN
jgi:hypothetical protein